MKTFELRDLFIYDLANNHQGDPAHASNIIKALGQVTRESGVRGALKFQFRQLATFIHPDYQARPDVKHIPRFMSTALTHEQYAALTSAVKESGMITMCTPFDEESVELILDLGIEVIKVASCSAADWPLLERIAEVNRPVVISTAGLSLQKIDRVVSFFETKGVNFALMHCVAIYPTPTHKLQLNQITLLRERYPYVPVGFSTHEEPQNFAPVRIAVAKGAQLFERHVGLATEQHALNAYSSTPEQIRGWLAAYQEALEACGGDRRSPASADELNSLRSLMRGVYAKEAIPADAPLAREKLFFAMPLQEQQLSSGEWVASFTADRAYAPNEPISGRVAVSTLARDDMIYRIMLEARGMLNQARIFIGEDSSVELSHHYGLERFREFGALIINCINREYCKKLIVQLPRQKHPYHFHKKKEETFQLLYGDIEVEKEGKRIPMQPGDAILVKPGEWHKFHTLSGAIFEEISTTHYNDDSFYEDEQIARLPRDRRKTYVDNWGALIRRNVERV